MKRYLLSLLAVLVVLVCVASPVLAYTFRAAYTITETSGTAYTMLPVIGNSNNSWMAANGFMAADGLDAHVETLGGMTEPRMIADNKTLSAIAVPANSQTNLYMTTGNTPDASMDIITGYGGYITVPDDTTIEMGNNWRLSIPGIYVQNGETLWSKASSANITTGSDNVTATIYAASANTSAYRPNAAGDETNLTPSAGANYACSGDNNDATYVATASGTYVRDLYNVPNHSVAIHGPILSITVTFRIATSNAGDAAYAEPAFKIGGTVYLGTEQTTTLDSFSDKTQTYTTSPATGVAWTWDEVDSLQYGITLHTNSAIARSADIWFIVTYQQDTTASIAASAGQRDVTVQQDSPSLAVSIDTSGNITPVADNLTVNAPVWQKDFATSPATTIDSNGLTLSYSANTTWTNAGLDLSAYNAQAGIAKNAAINNQHVFTIEALLTVNTTPAPAGVIWEKGYYYFYLVVNNSNGISARYRMTSGTDASCVTSTTIPLNTPTQVVAEYDGAGDRKIHIFINHVEASYSSNTASGTNWPDDSGQNVTIGYDPLDATWQLDGTIYALRYYTKILTTTEMAQNLAADALNFTGTGSIATVSTLASVPDNANDITVLSDVPYADSLALYVSSVRQLYYAPNAIISGTTMPDRETATANDGVITWGSNPAGVAVNLGSMVSSGQPSVGGASATPTPVDWLGTNTPSQQYQEPDTATKLSTNPLRPFVQILSNTTSLTEKQAWQLLGAAFVLGVFILSAKAVHGHYIITGILTGAAIGSLVALTIWPFWTITLIAMSVAAGAVAEKSPSL